MSKQPTGAGYAERVAGAGGPRRTVRRTHGLLTLAASVAVVAGGMVGLDRLLTDDAPGSSSDPASNASAPSAPVVVGPLDVSGSGVGTQPFGTDAGDVLAAVAARFGKPDLTVGPRRYARVPGSEGWFEDADDPLSPSWQYPITSVTCWRPGRSSASTAHVWVHRRERMRRHRGPRSDSAGRPAPGS